jgi:hypothetical protein
MIDHRFFDEAAGEIEHERAWYRARVPQRKPHSYASSITPSIR